MATNNYKPIPINTLPKADELVADDQLIAYREDTGKAYRSNVGSLGEAAESNISDAFSENRIYSAGDYVIYNDTLYKFTADKEAGEWDSSVVEKTNVGSEMGALTSNLEGQISEINQSLSELPVSLYLTDADVTSEMQKCERLKTHLLATNGDATSTLTNSEQTTTGRGFFICYTSGLCDFTLSISSASSIYYGRISSTGTLQTLYKIAGTSVL